MKSASIWTVALAATMSLACNGNISDNSAAGMDSSRTATAERAPATENPSGASATNRDPGGAATMARANDANEDRQFVEKMAHVNMAEVKIGQLAAERASNAQVKQYGRRMAAEHQKANEELKTIASKMAVQLPTALDAKHQELHDRLSKMKGPEFDKEYMQAMVDGHEEVARELEGQAGSPAAGERSVGTSGDANQAHASVTAWAKKTLPDVRQHLQQAKQIHAKL